MCGWGAAGVSEVPTLTCLSDLLVRFTRAGWRWLVRHCGCCCPSLPGQSSLGEAELLPEVKLCPHATQAWLSVWGGLLAVLSVCCLPLGASDPEWCLSSPRGADPDPPAPSSSGSVRMGRWRREMSLASAALRVGCLV